MQAFDEQHFGRHHAKKSVEQLDEEIEKVWFGPFINIKLLYIDSFTSLDCNVEWMKVSKRWLDVNLIEQLYKLTYVLSSPKEKVDFICSGD